MSQERNAELDAFRVGLNSRYKWSGNFCRVKLNAREYSQKPGYTSRAFAGFASGRFLLW